MNNLAIYPAGDAAFLVGVGDEIDPAVNRRVHAVAMAVVSALAGNPRVEVTPAYATFMVSFDPTVLAAETVEAAIQQAGSHEAPKFGESRRFTVPVCYGGAHGPDLTGVAKYHGISEEAVIELHTHREYPIYCLGFSPGFAFLGGLDPSLSTPRLETPRPRVPAGSVGIGGSQTGVYPTVTPGGWRLIGRTSVTLFDAADEPPVPYGPGDVVQFEAITPEEYDRLLATKTLLAEDS